jgi:rSAM/selenodomain-associated transferase 1
VQAKLLNHTIATAQLWQQTTPSSVLHLAIGSNQGAGGLAVRMQRQFSRAFQAKATQVVLIGSDLPQLSVKDLAAAFQALSKGDLVLGPALDGGYWLVGLNKSRGELFSGISWGGPKVLAETIACAQRFGLRFELLPYRSDLDHIGDMAPWLND